MNFGQWIITVLPASFLPALGIIAFIFIVSQVIGELIELFGKVAPSFLKLRKVLKKRRQVQREKIELLQQVKGILREFDAHYSEDNIQKRNDWMAQVNSAISSITERCGVCDNTVNQLIESFKENKDLTEQIFIQNCRDRIFDFAEKAGNHTLPLSREQFRRIFKVYERYEAFLQAHNKENGQVELNYHIIQQGYQYRVQHSSFIEDIRQDIRIADHN